MSSICQRIRQTAAVGLLRSQKKPFSTSRHASLHVVSKDKNDVFTQYTVGPSVYWTDRHNRTVKNPSSIKLVEKTVKDSYTEKLLPFKSDPALLDRYIFGNDRLRVGKFFEEIDKMAGAVALKHMSIDDPDTAPSLATACFDRIDILKPNVRVADILITGYLSYVGSKSMEIVVKAETVPENNGPKEAIFDTKAVLVGVDLLTHEPVKINSLKITSPDEEALYLAGKANIKRHREMATAVPNYEEATRKYNSLIVQENARKPVKTVWMRDTMSYSTMMTLPQERNLNNVAFGGYLMRRAFELANASTSLFMNSIPTLLSADQAIFMSPVEIGTVLDLKSMIVRSEDHTVQVHVVGEAHNVDTGETQLTNVFKFTFAKEDKSTKLPFVIPSTDEERRLWVESYCSKSDQKC